MRESEEKDFPSKDFPTKPRRPRQASGSAPGRSFPAEGRIELCGTRAILSVRIQRLENVYITLPKKQAPLEFILP